MDRAHYPKIGFVKVRGSSSRGAVRAVLGMRRELEQGWAVAFTIDGPRGPRAIGGQARAGAAGAAHRCTHGGISHRDRESLDPEYVGPIDDSETVFARVDAGESQIQVPSDADDSQKRTLHAELQAALERVREFARPMWGR